MLAYGAANIGNIYFTDANPQKTYCQPERNFTGLMVVAARSECNRHPRVCVSVSVRAPACVRVLLLVRPSIRRRLKAAVCGAVGNEASRNYAELRTRRSREYTNIEMAFCGV